MTDDRSVDLERKIDALARKRDYAADVLNKPLLAWSYQQEIDNLLSMSQPESTGKPERV